MTDFEKVDWVRRRCSADTCLFWLSSGAYTRSFWIGIFHIGNFCFWAPFLKHLLLKNCAVDFVEICNVYIGKMIIKAAKRIFNSDKICRSYSDSNFGVTFFGTQCITVFAWFSYKRSCLFLSCPCSYLVKQTASCYCPSSKLDTIWKSINEYWSVVCYFRQVVMFIVYAFYLILCIILCVLYCYPLCWTCLSGESLHWPFSPGIAFIWCLLFLSFKLWTDKLNK